MREILFRGKRIDNGEWIFGYLLEKYGKTERKFAIDPCNRFDETGWNSYEDDVEPIISETICQFTGLCDKNGVKIFENDIVNHEDYSDGACLTYAQYKTVSAVMIKDFMVGCKTLSGLPQNCIEEKRMEVVGNIYENPELIQR